MRIKTDARRQAIIDHAGAVFYESGYERASMSQIAARVGGSKATLYGYFKSKQELFLAMIADATASQSDALMAKIDLAGDDPRKALHAFGHAYLDVVLSPEMVAVSRICLSEGQVLDMGRKIYSQGPQRCWMIVAEHLQGWIDRGLLRPADANMVALHLRGLLEAGLFEPTLYGATPAFTREDAVSQAIDAFLRAYGN